MTLTSTINQDVINPSIMRLNIEPDFLSRVLIPYREDCCYLKNASMINEPSEKILDGQSLQGEFSIPNSCYIDSTGHFNAVEFNICYNQMCYVYFAHCIRMGIFNALSDFNEALFFEKQLSNFLIADLSSNYRAQINPEHFYGAFGLDSITVKKNCIFAKTWCRFHDEDGGNAKGKVLLAILKP